MKIIYKLFLLFTILTSITGCDDDFLEKPPKDLLLDESYWNSEENVKTFAYGFYTGYFTGYGSSFAFGDYFTGQSLNDDFAASNPPLFTQQVPTSGGGWSFA
ncbi:MAG: RagB/SusD family nutrient uptake outer membrane protein, partial [Leeuwenhoekiella sp.]